MNKWLSEIHFKTWIFYYLNSYFSTNILTTICPCSENLYKSGHHINSISCAEPPSLRPTIKVEFDVGLFLCCLGICALCFALNIASSAESGVAELFSLHTTFPEYRTSVLKLIWLSPKASKTLSASKIFYDIWQVALFYTGCACGTHL